MDIRKLILPLAIFILLIYNTNLIAQDEDTTQLRDPEFLTNADQLVEDLKARLTLSDDQAKEIREILVDYQENVTSTGNSGEEEQSSDMNADNANLDTENNFEENQSEVDSDISRMSAEEDAEVGMNEDEADIVENWNQDQTGTDDNSEVQNPRETANNAIEEILNETQRTTWNIISDAWWRDVNNRYGWEQNKQEY